MIEERFEEQSYRLTIEPGENGCYVDVKIYQLYDEGDLEFQGDIKWDGCSNWNIGNAMLHFCNPNDIDGLAIVIKRAYELAKQFFKHCDYA